MKQPTIEQAIRKVTDEYFYAVKSNYIRKPLSWALYTAWKYFDAREAARGAENAENEPEAQASE